MSNVNDPLCRLPFVPYLPGNSPFVTWSTKSVGAAEPAPGLTKRQIAELGGRGHRAGKWSTLGAGKSGARYIFRRMAGVTPVRPLGETLRYEVIDRSESISILRNGPSAPNGGRSSVRMGVELDDTLTAAGRPSG